MAIIGAFMVPHPPLIIPEVGRGQEKKISATIRSYREVGRRTAELHPDTIVITTPHSVMYADYFHISPGRSAQGSFRSFGAGEAKIRTDYDTEFAEALSSLCREEDFPAGTQGEKDPELDHASMIPLYFVNQFYTGYRTVRIGLSGLSLPMHYRLGTYIRKTAEDLGRRIVFIGSGDLSHRLKEDGPYGFAKEGPEYDARIMDVMGEGNFGELLSFDEDFCEKAGECGHRSFTIMAGALDGTAVKAEKLSYEGPFGVGYGVCAYQPLEADASRRFLDLYEEKRKAGVKAERSREDDYVRLARSAVEAYIRRHKRLVPPEDLPPEMKNGQAGAFVSIHEDGRLRGCIGTISAAENCIAEEIVSNAISASTKDPRFDPITEDELPYLSITVDILGEAEDIDSPDQLDVKKYGVIVSKGWKRGLLLPNLDGVQTVSEQIRIAQSKAGIPAGEKDVHLQRFQVVRHY
ncbi:MAG: AmmeMemoRadiSam system protein A [Lachnospiraceae bacterium]|jgi:AmmeMemoRadiSam system protein A|nr:AmmeMemoRadiSam system protein A [Lachnospiraceae bacterium]